MKQPIPRRRELYLSTFKGTNSPHPPKKKCSFHILLNRGLKHRFFSPFKGTVRPRGKDGLGSGLLSLWGERLERCLHFKSTKGEGRGSLRKLSAGERGGGRLFKSMAAPSLICFLAIFSRAIHQEMTRRWAGAPQISRGRQQAGRGRRRKTVRSPRWPAKMATFTWPTATGSLPPGI